jgi:hypothetical protein
MCELSRPWRVINRARRAGDGTETRRSAEPHRLICHGRRWYLLAFDLDRNDWRIFRADRIRDPLATGARSAPRELPAADAVSYVTGKVYSLAPTYQAVATLPAPAGEIARQLGDYAAELGPLDEQARRLRTHRHPGMAGVSAHHPRLRVRSTPATRTRPIAANAQHPRRPRGRGRLA